MKYILLSIFVTTSFISTHAFANFATPGEEREIMFGVNDALLPKTVKANTTVGAVISGLFPNSCYRYNRSQVTHDLSNKIHEVRNYAMVNQGMCLTVMVPFTREIAIGALDEGEHRIRFMGNDGTYLEKRIIAE